MPIASIENYLDHLSARMAELQLALADVVSLPHMKKSQHSATVSGWMRAVQLITPMRSRPASKARLKMMGIGVRIVPVERPNTEST